MDGLCTEQALDGYTWDDLSAYVGNFVEKHLS